MPPRDRVVPETTVIIEYLDRSYPRELAHLWSGQSALSNVSVVEPSDNSVEVWCNQVAAELLVPMAVFEAELRANESLAETLTRLARRFKVSTPPQFA